MSIQPGTNLGQYRIVEQLGRGGMATVYKVYQPGLDRYVAIKVLPSFYAEDPEYLGRFRQEAISIARLRHPNILAVYDYGEQGGITYIVSEYVPGGTLAKYLGKPVELDLAISLLKPVTSALDYAHSRKPPIIHRDIKPSNILLAEDGTPVVSDFGIAKIVGEGVTTQTGQAMGTPEYMAPEQALGKATTASDIYSLGIVMYHLLTGRVPYSADTPMAIMLAHINNPLPMPRALRPDLSESVEAVILKALAKQPEDRFGTAGEMVAALERAAAVETAPSLSDAPTLLRSTPPLPGEAEVRASAPDQVERGGESWTERAEERPRLASLWLKLQRLSMRRRAALAGPLAVVLLVAAWLLLSLMGQTGRPTPTPGGLTPSRGDQMSGLAAVVTQPSPRPMVEPPVEVLTCPGPPPPLVTDLEPRETPSVDQPAPRVPFRDPTFGSCVVQVTDRKADLKLSDPAKGLMSQYSRVQAFNADGSRLMVRSTEASWYLYDARSLQPLGRLDFDGVDPRWDPGDPDVLYFSFESRLMSLNVRTGDQTLVHDFSPDLPGQRLAAVWTHDEGSPSLDGRYWGFVAEDENWVTVALLVYDRQTDRVIAMRDLRGVPGPEGDPVDPAAVTISPLGNYMVVSYEGCGRGTLGDDGHPCGLMVYDRGLEMGRGLLPGLSTGDLALDAEGREVLVFHDEEHQVISMIDLVGGDATELWPTDSWNTGLSLKISGRALLRPGWVVVSAYTIGQPPERNPMDGQIFLLELKKGGRVVRVAHTHSVFQEQPDQVHWEEPHATANQDLTRILFASNWGRPSTEEVDSYVVQLPADWPERLPPPR